MRAGGAHPGASGQYGLIVADVAWHPGDMLILTDPYLGGTHLPDVTLIAPVFSGNELAGFVANRAHHADIGAQAPGSMPISRTLAEEGQAIPPQLIMREGRLEQGVLDGVTRVSRNRRDVEGDLAAQLGANQRGVARLSEGLIQQGVRDYFTAVAALNDYAERLARQALAVIPPGECTFCDVMDDDGLGHTGISIAVKVHVSLERIAVDFTGTADQVEGNINCSLSVTAAGVLYVFRCLMPPYTPACAGAFRAIDLEAPPGSLVNAQRPAACAAGNVETSTRIVDVMLGALAKAIPDRIPAARHGSMNNLALGSADWGYYETIGGGMGAGLGGGGLHAVQTHMTNTRNTPIEVLEARYPLRVTEYAIRRGSGGRGHYPGGDGLNHEFEFTEPACATLLTERRRHAPWDLAGGAPGAPGRNTFNGQTLPGKVSLDLNTGDRLRIETAGGGGWGRPVAEPDSDG